MKRIKMVMRNMILKFGNVIAACAFVFVTLAANSPCVLPYYEPEEPEGLDQYKRLDK